MRVVDRRDNEVLQHVHVVFRHDLRVELDPQRLGDVEHRIEAVLGCARKFRSSPDELPTLLARWQERLAVLGEAADIAGLEARVATARKYYDDLSRRLSKGRAKAAEALRAATARLGST